MGEELFDAGNVRLALLSRLLIEPCQQGGQRASGTMDETLPKGSELTEIFAASPELTWRHESRGHSMKQSENGC